MSDTGTKPIRRFIHLGQSVASQVRERAAIWGLNESETIHQLIHVGLRASVEGAGSGESDRELRQVKVLVMEVLRYQLEALLYQRDTTAGATLIPSIFERLAAVESVLDNIRNATAGAQNSAANAAESDKQRATLIADEKRTAKKIRDEALPKLDASVRELAREAFTKIRDQVLATDVPRPRA